MSTRHIPAALGADVVPVVDWPTELANTYADTQAKPGSFPWTVARERWLNVFYGAGR